MGTTIGVVGLLGQLFDGCVKAYGYFTTAQHFDADSQRLLCKVRIEEMRLVVWGREWGVAEGLFEAHLERGDKGNPQLRALATQILEQLHGTVTDFKKLKETYGLADEAETPDPGGGSGLAGQGIRLGKGNGDGAKTGNIKREKSPAAPGKDEKGRKSSNGGKAERSWRKEFQLKTKWVITGKFLERRPFVYSSPSPS